MRGPVSGRTSCVAAAPATNSQDVLIRAWPVHAMTSYCQCHRLLHPSDVPGSNEARSELPLTVAGDDHDRREKRDWDHQDKGDRE